MKVLISCIALFISALAVAACGDQVQAPLFDPAEAEITLAVPTATPVVPTATAPLIPITATPPPPTSTSVPTTTPQTHYILGLGDSKTYGAGDPAPNHPGYLPRLVDLLTITRKENWSEARPRLAVGGSSTADMRSYLIANINQISPLTPPQLILINLGTNDVPRTGTFDPAQWSSDYGAILDLLHVVWPDARIGVMRVMWRTSADRRAHMDQMDDELLPALLASRPWTFMGPDERDFLAGSDDFATYTDDGIQPNPAGYQRTAEEWLKTLP